MSSPRTWGCFYTLSSLTYIEMVFPTHVGVFPCCSSRVEPAFRLPHARGGVSTSSGRRSLMRWSSPRTWGCFLVKDRQRLVSVVFPTHVGVFLLTVVIRFKAASLPHARGGVSYSLYTTFFDGTVFPTHVGVFLPTWDEDPEECSLPHARGGVSTARIESLEYTKSSPRTWGCFWNAGLAQESCEVFPTHVGVFLRRLIAVMISGSLPHARGGVSCEGSTSIGVLESSLHMWDLAISGILVLE